MNIKLLAVLSLGTLVACGDSGSSGSGGSGTGGEATGGAATGGAATGGNGTGGDATGGAATGGAATGGNGTGGAEVCGLEGVAAPEECQAACEIAYDCGATCALCPGFSGVAEERDAFIAGCLKGCADSPELVAVTNPEDCGATIEILNTQPSFAQVCQNGFGK